MLGYDAYVHEIRPGVSEEDVRRIAQFQYKERMSYLDTLTSRRVAHVPCRTWVDKLLNVSDQLPKLRLIVYCDARGMRKHVDPRLVSAEDLARRGAAAARHIAEQAALTRSKLRKCAIGP